MHDPLKRLLSTLFLIRMRKSIIIAACPLLDLIMKLLASLLFILLIFLQIKLWFSGHGIFQLWSIRSAIEQSQIENENLMGRNERLHAEVQELREGREALEERARSQLGFIKEGETFYRVIPKRDSGAGGSN